MRLCFLRWVICAVGEVGGRSNHIETERGCCCSPRRWRKVLGSCFMLGGLENDGKARYEGEDPFLEHALR